MRAIWKGSIAFGLVSVPVALYTATQDHDLHFHQVHAEDGGRVRYDRVCRTCGEVLSADQIDKAYQVPGGPLVVLTEQDFANLQVTAAKEIAVVEFVPKDQIDPVRFDKAYLLGPEGHVLKPYVLLRKTLAATDLAAVVTVAMRSKQQLGLLRVCEDVLMLQTMLWPDEVRSPHFDVLDEPIDISRQELAMASSLVESMSGDFVPEKYADVYREQLLAVIESKVSGGEGVVVPTASPAEPATDLLSALRESLEQAGVRKTPRRSKRSRKSA